MQSRYRFLGSLLLSASLLGSGAILVGSPVPAIAQDHDDHNRDTRRVYDSYHHDYHNWDDREDRVYRQWLEEKHQA